MELLLEAAILAADPDGAQQAAAAAVQERFVRLGRTSQHGLKLIIARAAAGDAMCFTAITLLGTRCTINLKPVIDLPAGHIPIDSYEIPASLREQLLLRYPADVFPYAAAVSRRIDADHTSPYLSPDRGGPPGQTRIGNLGPYVRRNHNRKTHGRWQVRQPEPGTWLWRSPRGRIYLVNSIGTHPLGDSAYAQTIWHAADASTPALVS
jgi:hypothetical protein